MLSLTRSYGPTFADVQLQVKEILEQEIAACRRKMAALLEDSDEVDALIAASTRAFDNLPQGSPFFLSRSAVACWAAISVVSPFLENVKRAFDSLRENYRKQYASSREIPLVSQMRSAKRIQSDMATELALELVPYVPIKR